MGVFQSTVSDTKYKAVKRNKKKRWKNNQYLGDLVRTVGLCPTFFCYFVLCALLQLHRWKKQIVGGARQDFIVLPVASLHCPLLCCVWTGTGSSHRFIPLTFIPPHSLLCCTQVPMNIKYRASFLWTQSCFCVSVCLCVFVLSLYAGTEDR